MLVVNFLFSLTLIFSCFIIFSRNAMMSKLSFILVVLIVCFLLTYLELEFIIFSYLLIYIGAICVLFLLVIKMLQMDYTSSKNIWWQVSLLDSFFYGIFVFKLYYFFSCLNSIFCSSCCNISKEYFVMLDSNSFSNSVVVMGDCSVFLTLFVTDIFLFIILSFILVFAMVGSIALCYKLDYVKGE